MRRVAALARAMYLPILSFPSFALLYFVIMGRVSVYDVVLSRWLYRVWAVSAIGGAAFYFIVCWLWEIRAANTMFKF